MTARMTITMSIVASVMQIATLNDDALFRDHLVALKRRWQFGEGRSRWLVERYPNCTGWTISGVRSERDPPARLPSRPGSCKPCDPEADVIPRGRARSRPTLDQGRWQCRRRSLPARAGLSGFVRDASSIPRARTCGIARFS
ncbi:hypothetical protein FFLO_05263 [Filobasidium floriforme]|uniref:Uncharacterized protein n=1 Tax=Filobasidium floriforme TaxID=5210 RepID=A0A8K0JHS7_9TREE|nr:hypothetical protein FFLO_05263 [Filobasidium floriforme]